MTIFYDLRAILSDADVLATLTRYYERGWDRILNTLALGIHRPGSMRTRLLLRKLRAIIAGLDPKRDSAVRWWIRDYVRKAFLAGERQAVDAIPGSALNVPARAMSDTVGNAIAALDQKLGFVAAQMDAVLSGSIMAAARAMLINVELRDGMNAGILRSAKGRAVADDLQTVILQGSDQVTASRLVQAGIPRFVVEGLDKLNRGIITVGKASVSIPAYVRQTAQDALAETHNSASLIVAQRNKIDHVFIDKEASRRICRFCATVEFNVFYNGPEFRDPMGFPRLKDLPPGPKWHPNCAHVVVPWPIASKSQAEIDEALANALAIPAEFYGPGAVDRVNEGGGEAAFHKDRERKHA